MSNEKQDINKLALKAGSWYVVSSVILKSIGVITTPIFTRLMTPEEYGITATFTSWSSLLALICTLNLSYSIGRAKLDYPDRLDHYIGSMQMLSLMVTSVLAVILFVFIDSISVWFELPAFAVILLIIKLLSTPAVEFYQNGCRYRYRYKENIRISCFLVLSNVLLSLFFMLGFDGDRAIFRILGGVIPLAALAMLLWYKSWRAGWISFNTDFWRYGLLLSLPLVVHAMSLNLLAQSDRIFIAKLCNQADVGVYSIAYSYGLLMTVVTSAVASGWLPWFHDKYHAGEFLEIRKNVKLIVCLGCSIGLICVALAPEAIKLLGGESYMAGLYCVAPISCGVVCQYVYTHYVNIELHLKKTKFVPIGTIIAAISNLALNAVFIPLFGFVAAAYTTFFSYIVLLLMHWWYTRFRLKVQIYNDSYMFISILVTVVLAGMFELLYDIYFLRYLAVMLGIASIGMGGERCIPLEMKEVIKKKLKC